MKSKHNTQDTVVTEFTNLSSQQFATPFADKKLSASHKSATSSVVTASGPIVRSRSKHMHIEAITDGNVDSDEKKGDEVLDIALPKPKRLCRSDK